MSYFRIATATLLLVASLASMTSAQSVEPQPSPQVTAVQAKIRMMIQEREFLKLSIASSLSKLEELAVQKSDFLKQQDSIGISPESFPEIIKTLQSQRIQLTVDLAGLEARRNMLAEAKAENSHEVNSKVLRPLMEILEIEKAKLDEVQELVAKGAQSKAAFLSAKQQVLTIEVQIAEAKSRQVNSAYASRVNSNLLDAALEHADKQARLETTQVLLKKLTASRSLVENSTAKKREAMLIETQMAETASRVQIIEEKINQLQMELDQIQ